MGTYGWLRDVWGSFRGYNRRSIRRSVALASGCTADELNARTLELRQIALSTALARFPRYAERVRECTGTDEIKRLAFEDLPVLNKTDIMWMLDDPDRKTDEHVIMHATGGSTGQPFRFAMTRASYEWRTAVSDRGYSWAGAEEGRQSFYVWGTSISPSGWRQGMKRYVHHWLQNRRYFDSFHFDDEQKAACCNQINRFRPHALVGYAGNLIELARYVECHPGVLRWRARTGVTAAEGLRPGMRELIEEHLVDEVFMSYGSREFMLIGMESEQHAGYHLSSDNLYVEVVDDAGRPCGSGETGRIVVTDLHNTATPFMRYAIGDLGAMGEPCGLPFPVLERVEGRLQEVIVKPDGERLTALFVPHLMKEFAWVDGYQIVQLAPGKITVNLVTSADDWERQSKAIVPHLKARLGDEMVIEVAQVDKLKKKRSGKTPIVIAVDQV